MLRRFLPEHQAHVRARRKLRAANVDAGGRARRRQAEAAYEAKLLQVVEVAATGLPGKTSAARRKLAWGVLSILSGGVTLARAVNDPKVSTHIAIALKTAIDALVSAASAAT